MISRGATFPRGSLIFDEKTLSSQLKDASKSGEIFTSVNGYLLDEYRECYGLDFQVTNYRAGLLRVAEESIFLQFFERQDSDCRKKRECILISHGYYDHAGLYGHLIEHLLSRGWNVAIFDHIGHGLSSGSRAEIQDFDQYVQVLSRVVEQLENKENQKKKPPRKRETLERERKRVSRAHLEHGLEPVRHSGRHVWCVRACLRVLRAADEKIFVRFFFSLFCENSVS